ncbi:MAG: acyl-CoA dehydrogenase [Saprospiraceae bacterium]|nr:acyl-CoA dehydrogenase [Saprospiraceae bacterium]
MAQYINMDNLRFYLFEVLDMDEILKYEAYQDYDQDGINILLDSIKDWADKSFYPYFREMDEQPVHYKDGVVYSHEQIGKVMKEGGENGYLGAYFKYEDMGSQMPRVIFAATSHILQCANNNLPGYLNLTAGAASLIANFATRDLFDKYVPKMLSGEWGGTMALTEPQAGSSLSDITTSAAPNEDGSYSIKGQKIFISGGDHQGCDNFVHLTLARIEGAPKGTKGISLFIIPKHRIEDDGTLSYNDVFTASDFQKLGQRGYSTVHLVFGENENCKGWLVGEANKGLSYMFQMMNGARIDVGLTAASTATAAYYASLQYAKERPQGRPLTEDGKKNVDAEQTIIINHPDVKRMLLFQKAILEGALSLIFYCSALEDKVHNDSDSEAHHLLLELLTPVAKTFPSEKGKDTIDQGLQVLGGYGFCMDFPLQQYYRDIRIMPIYEGTTGIQSLDLLGRKIPMAEGKALGILQEKITHTIKEASKHESLKPYADQLTNAMQTVQSTLGHLMPFAMQKAYQSYLADATIFMDLFSYTVVGWQWLHMGLKSIERLNSETGISRNFYESKLHTMKFYYKYEMPKVKACAKTIVSGELLTVGDKVLDYIN